MALSNQQIQTYNKIVAAASKIYKGAKGTHFGLKGDVLQVNISVSKYITPEDVSKITDVFKAQKMKKIKVLDQPGTGSPKIIQGQDS